MKRVLWFLVNSMLAIITGCATYEKNTPRVILARSQGLSVKQDEVDEIWKFTRVLTNTSSSLRPPIIYFVAFDKQKIDQGWISWQERWLKRASLQEDIYKSDLEGYFYSGTTLIQIKPELFTSRGSRVATQETREWGMYTIAHEILHYIFEQKGILGFLHHCIMDQGGYDRKIMSFVIHKEVRFTPLSGICENIPRNLIELGLKQSQEPLS